MGNFGMDRKPGGTAAVKKSIRRIFGDLLSQLLNVPIIAGLLTTYLFFSVPIFLSTHLASYALTMLSVCLVPMLSLLFYIPFENEDAQSTSHRQRLVSFIIMLISYPAGWILLALTSAPHIFTAVAATYTCVVLGLTIFNVLHYNASGHAAGVAGPVAIMIYLYGLIATPLLLLLPLVVWARLATEGHTLWQTVVGATMSALISTGVLWAFGFPPFMGAAG
jgi:hypothetical protein